MQTVLKDNTGGMVKSERLLMPEHIKKKKHFQGTKFYASLKVYLKKEVQGAHAQHAVKMHTVYMHWCDSVNLPLLEYHTK